MQTEQIAVIGLSCLFPDAENPEQFWQNLVQGKDSTSNATRDEFGVDPQIFQGEGKENPDQTYSIKGGFIRNFRFDAAGYGIAPDKIAGLDPIAQASLYVARQALQNSGYWEAAWGPNAPQPALRDKCGVILGNLSLPLHHSNRLFGPMYEDAIAPAVQELLQDPEFRFQSLPGAHGPIDPKNARMSSLPSQIVAEALSLSSLHFALDAACSSSLYAVELARHYLLSGEADLMLAGAASYSDSLFIRMLFSGLQAYPDNGVSCPFDQRSRGLTPADGVGMLVLKRYRDAVRDGDRIHALVSGVGLSNDGRGKHLLSPNQKGQMIAFERAYEAADLSPQDVDYVECHATGTLLGDSTELSSIDEFFHRAGARPLVGAVKANTGHLLTAAGMVSLLKVILGMEHGLIPPTINVQQPQSSPNGIVSPDRIVTEPTPWPTTGRPKRTAINAFGFGGTNAHLILEESPQTSTATSAPGMAPGTAPGTASPFVPHKTKLPLAIVGMDACFGDADGLDAIERTFYDGLQQFKPLPQQRWKGLENCTDLLKAYGFESGTAPEGAYIDQVDIDPIRYKIPPNEVNKLQPQQLLMLKVADRALQDAKIQPGDNVAVLIAMETELSIHQLQQRWNFDWQVEAGLAATGGTLPPDKLAALTQMLKDSLHPPAQTSEYVGYIGNIMPSRISALWDFKAPSFTLSAGEDSALKALEVAQNLLAYGHADAVLVGAVDLAGGFEPVLLRNRAARINQAGKATLSFDQQAQGAMIGEGAGAVVLKRLETARAAGDRIYSVVETLHFANLPPAESLPQSTTPAASASVAASCASTYAQAGIAPAEIGYLEVCGSGVPQADSAEMQGITQAYRLSDSPNLEAPTAHLTCALGSATANIGHTGVAAAIASLIKTSLCLYHRYIPAVPQWSTPQQPQAGADIWDKTPFYVASESRGWLLGDGVTKRRAALNHISAEGIISHLVMSEEPAQTLRSREYLEQRPVYLFAIAGGDRADLETQLATFEQALNATDSLAQLARTTFQTYRQNAHQPYTLTLVGSQKDKLLRDLSKAMQTAIAKAFETGQDWQAPSGSYFTARPQGHPQGVNGKVAFVYPGAFGCYVGQARNRFRLFPEIFEMPLVEQLVEPLNRIGRLFYPRSLQAFSKKDGEALDLQLLANPIAMFEAEIGCSGITSALLQDCFKLQPQMAFGYSIGEISMMLSQRVFEDEAMRLVSAQLDESPLFHSRIYGPKNAVRDYWGLPSVTDDDALGLDPGDDQGLWGNFVLVATAADVKAAIAPFDHVYLTQINTANEVVIAGEPALCQQVIDTLGCQGFRAPFNYVMHCPAMASEHGDFAKMNTMPLKPNLTNPVQVYSTATYGPIALESQGIGQAIATNLCNGIDFPRLVNQVYNDGARIFVEVGAGSTCSRWIDSNLADRPHLVTSLNRRGSDDHLCVLQTLAKLVSHRVPLDLMPLYGDVDAPQPKRAMVKTVPLGGQAIAATLLSETNRALFKDVKVDRSKPAERVELAVELAVEHRAPEPSIAATHEPSLTFVLPEPQPDEPRSAEEQRSSVDPFVPKDLPERVTTLADQPLIASQLALSQAHAAFLENRKAALKKMRDLLTQEQP